jgi:hypothetical protein
MRPSCHHQVIEQRLRFHRRHSWAAPIALADRGRTEQVKCERIAGGEVKIHDLWLKFTIFSGAIPAVRTLRLLLWAGKKHGQAMSHPMTARPPPPVYRIYLLTVWHTQRQPEAATPEWRFHLTDPRTGKRYGFTKAEELLARLQQLADEPADED